MAQFNPLRPITQRLNTTPVEELPHYAGFLAASIMNCSSYFQELQVSKSGSAIQVHKLVTRITSLLQDKTQEGRFVAVVLLKALIEVSGPQYLAESGLTWVRGLLTCLNKHDPAELKKLVIVAITRIYMLTYGIQTMVREITTPSLPSFLSACMNAIKPTIATKTGPEKQIPSPLLESVLQCWAQLIKAFPSTFRPFVPSIRAILLSQVSQSITPQTVKEVAYKTLASLHLCAPKDTTPTEWLQSIQNVMEAIHQTTDLICRSVIEDWSPLNPRLKGTSTKRKVNGEVHTSKVDAIGLEKWTGVRTGTARTIDLLGLLRSLLSVQHAQAVRAPLAEVLDLTARLTAIVPPSDTYSLRENKEIERDERDELFNCIPGIHSAVLDLYGSLAQVYSSVLLPVSGVVLSQIWDVQLSTGTDNLVRPSLYNAIRELLEQNVMSVAVADADQIARLIKQCCNDLKYDADNQSGLHSIVMDNKSPAIDLALQKRSQQHGTRIQSLNTTKKAAWELLPVLLAHIAPGTVSMSTRAELDRTAIIIGHDEALLASVLNPPETRRNARVAPSVLPFLARVDSRDPAVEALLRPRRPVLALSLQIETDGDAESLHETEVLESKTLLDTAESSVTNGFASNLEAEVEDLNEHSHYELKKRDHATLEDATPSSNLDSWKKPKLDTYTIEERAIPETIVVDPIPANESMISNHGNDDLSSVASGATLTFKPESLAPGAEIQSHMVSTLPNTFKDDESDDSEIPMIDPALSSDEDDDDDVDDGNM